MPDNWKVGTDKDNSNQVFIKDNWIHSIQEVIVEGPEVDIVEKIKKAKSKDEEIVRVVEEMKKAGVKELRGEDWKLEEDLVLKERKVYVPKDEELRAEVIQLHHDVPVAGHGGVSDKELLVAGYNKGCRKICERVQFMPKDKE